MEFETVEEVRTYVERLGGCVGPLQPNARWINLEGVFTPEQLRLLADAIEEAFKDRS